MKHSTSAISGILGNKLHSIYLTFDSYIRTVNLLPPGAFGGPAPDGPVLGKTCPPDRSVVRSRWHLPYPRTRSGSSSPALGFARSWGRPLWYKYITETYYHV